MKPLTESERRRRNAALTIVKTLSEEKSVIAKPLTKIDIINIPNSVEPAIKNWIRRQPHHEVYGSSAMATHSIHARRPQDLDMVINKPAYAAHALSQLMQKRGIKTKIVANPEWGSYVIQIKVNGILKDAIDIHPVKGHSGKYDFYGSSQSPLNRDGINIQSASDQLLRKANAITQRQKGGRIGAPPQRELKDTIDFITTAELLAESMSVKGEAQRERAKKVKEELRIWKSYLKSLKGEKRKKAIVKRDPLSETRENAFVREAVKNPDVDVDELLFTNGKLRITRATKHKTKTPAKSPYARSPYKHKTKSKSKRRTKTRTEKKKDDLLDLINKAF